MYIWFGDGGWLHSSDDKKDVPPDCYILGEFSQEYPELFWKYMKEKQGWYDNGALIDFMRYNFDFPHPTYICVVIRSKRSGKIRVQSTMIKYHNKRKWEQVHELPKEFCYNKEAAVDSFMYYHGYMIKQWLLNDTEYSDLEFMTEIDTEEMKYLLYKTECEYDESEDRDDREKPWILPEEIIPHPYQEEIVAYIKKEFATNG